MALTKKQKDWCKRVWNPYFCYFPMYSERRGFYYCGSTSKVELHHIQPQGFLKRVLGWNPDFALNIVPCCSMHHVGKGYKGTLDHHNELVPVIHTDMAYGLRNYGRDGKEGLNKIFAGREKRTDSNPPQKYWNDDWSIFLQNTCNEIVGRYLREHPEDPFPEKRRK